MCPKNFSSFLTKTLDCKPGLYVMLRIQTEHTDIKACGKGGTMMSNFKDFDLDLTNKIKVIVFAAVAYGLPWLLSLWIPSDNNDIFPVYMMILPTFGIVLGRSICERKIYGWFHWLYTIAFAGYTGVMILWVTEVISGEAAYDMYLVLMVLSVGLLLGSIINEQEFYPFKNFKKSVPIYLLFVVITQITNLPMMMKVGAGDVLAEISSELFITPVILIATECIYIFGEEYAWRGCLQGRLQRLFGKRMGVIILGIIWELWHMPLWFTAYGLNQEKRFLLLVLMRMLHAVGLAVFLSWAYMKTQNIWLCVLIHGVNNSAAVSGYSQLNNTAAIETSDSFYMITICVSAMIMLLFLFSKEYGKENLKTDKIKRGLYHEYTGSRKEDQSYAGQHPFLRKAGLAQAAKEGQRLP